jgi:hypothetical protein
MRCSPVRSKNLPIFLVLSLMFMGVLLWVKYERFLCREHQARMQKQADGEPLLPVASASTSNSASDTLLNRARTTSPTSECAGALACDGRFLSHPRLVTRAVCVGVV